MSRQLLRERWNQTVMKTKRVIGLEAVTASQPMDCMLYQVNSTFTLRISLHVWLFTDQKVANIVLLL